tara:strand:- start:1414 stop:1803 length:390 start_codon:yes stop_codon:yes gene_type:complete
MGPVMGFINRLKMAFSSKPEQEKVVDEEFHDPHQKKMTEAFVERQQSVIDDAMTALELADEKVRSDPVPTAASNYDAGEVEMQDLFADEEHHEDHSEVNVVEHLSVEELGEHLKSAKIEGDIPDEIHFE